MLNKEQLLQQEVESETFSSCTGLCAIRDGKLFFFSNISFIPLQFFVKIIQDHSGSRGFFSALDVPAPEAY